jgi:hypothetical protein
MDEWTRRMLAEQNYLSSTVQSQLDRQKKFGLLSDLDKYSSYGQLSAVRQAALDSERISPALGLNSNSAVLSGMERLSQYSSAAEALRQQELNDRYRLALPASMVEEARKYADLAQAVEMQYSLDRFRPATELLADKLQHFHSLEVFAQHGNLAAFVQAATVAEALKESSRVDSSLFDVAKQFSLTQLPVLYGRSDYSSFLDASGLLLPKWPNPRLLTIGQKRHRLNLILRGNAESAHERKGKSLVKRYELALRAVLDEAMYLEYGEDWAESRLPLCDCKDLLGKWTSRGGNPLDHADYAHYRKIMVNPEHFEEVFSRGFDDPDHLASLLKRAGELRNALAHHHPFSPNDLRDLRTTWSLVETGLLAITADYDFDS